MSPFRVDLTSGPHRAPQVPRSSHGPPHGLPHRPAWLLAAALVVFSAGLLGFASQPLGPSAAFLPAFLTLVLAINLLTGVLLAVQYRDVRFATPFLTQICMYAALKTGELLIVGPLVSTTPVFTLLLAFLFLRDSERVTLRTVSGVAAIVIGVVLLKMP